MNVLLYQYFYNGAGVAVGDLNNDGLQDIAVGNQFASVSIRLGNGAGGFSGFGFFDDFFYRHQFLALKAGIVTR